LHAHPGGWWQDLVLEMQELPQAFPVEQTLQQLDGLLVSFDASYLSSFFPYFDADVFSYFAKIWAVDKTDHEATRARNFERYFIRKAFQKSICVYQSRRREDLSAYWKPALI
jgi:hypothetical protein